MLLVAGLLLVCSAVDQVQLIKFRKQVHASLSASTGPQPQPIPPPLPPPFQAPALAQELLDDARLLQPLLLAPQAPLLPLAPLPPAPLPPPPPAPAQPAPIYQTQQEFTGLEASATKGGSGEIREAEVKGRLAVAPAIQPAPVVAQRDTIAYLLVKPYSKFQNYYDPSLAHYARPIAPAGLLPPAQSPIEYARHHEQQQIRQLDTKGGARLAEQQPLPPPPPPPAPPADQPHAIVVPIQAKEGKLKAMIDKLMSKITLGSSYHVLSEEIVPPAPAVAQAEIEQQQIEQQREEKQVWQPEIEQQQQQQIEQQQQQQQHSEQLEQSSGGADDERGFEQQQQQQLPLEQQRDLTSGFGDEKSARPQLQEAREQQQQQQLKEDQQLQQTLLDQQEQLVRQPQPQQPAKGLASSSSFAGERLPLARQPQEQFEAPKGVAGKRTSFNGHQQRQEQLAFGQDSLRQQAAKST